MLVVLTSDHGEQLGEPGRPGTAWGKTFYDLHGHTVYEELIRVPLIFKLPGGASHGQRLPFVTASVDVMPTILDVLGLPAPAEVQGRSLRPLWEGGAWPVRNALSEALSGPTEQKSLRGERYKYVVTIDARSVQARGRSFIPPGAPAALFDLLRDPGERHDLLAGETDRDVRQRALALSDELRHRLSKVGRPETGLVSEETLEGLKALGYVE
jgi:arylsulfatase A-like enzyme